MKTSSKFALAASPALAAAVLVPAIAIPVINSNVSETHIISINDFHGAAPGFGETEFSVNKLNAGAIRLANETQNIIKKYPGSLLISAGDLNAGESFSTVSHADTFYPVLKGMDIKFSAVGNHAWEWGWTDQEFLEHAKMAKPDDTQGQYFLTSNVMKVNTLRDKKWCITPTNTDFEKDFKIWNENRITWADPYKLIDMNGHLICFIGLTTTDTLKDGNLNSVKNLSFIDYNASVCYSKYKLLKDLVEQGKEDEYDKIEAFVLDTHCECEPSSKTKWGIAGETVSLAENLTTRVDAIISAHSHRTCAGKVKNKNFDNYIAIGQAGQSGRYFLDLALKFNDNNAPGYRLKDISVSVKQPYIDYGGVNMNRDKIPAEDMAKAKAAAKNQIVNIVTSTQNQVVANTASVYEVAKAEALKELDKVIGTIDADMPYYYTEHTERSFGTQFMQSPTLVEKIGAWTNKAQIIEFNKEYKEAIEKQQIYPISIAITNLDSLKNGLKLDQAGQKKSVTKNDIFTMHAFENPLHYGTMTVHQLEQYIDYFLEGAGKFNYSSKPGYDKTLYLDDENKTPITWDASETVNDNKELGVSYVSGCNQFYGFRFDVLDNPTPVDEEDTETHKVYKYWTYKYKPGSLKIYNPLDSTNKIDDPDTWTTGENWTKNKVNNGLIPYAVASFTWQGGNGQNRMLHHWADYNSKNDTRAAHKMFSKNTRDVALMYINDCHSASPEIMVNEGISDELINKLIGNLQPPR